MSEIKCPVCGSGIVTELSEEQYLCEACGNKFQKHNLSKEFQKTDAHIEDVHRDLKESIKNLENSRGQNDSWKVDLENAYNAAVTFLDRGEVDEAYERFSDLSEIYPWSYKGWYGKFLCGHRRGLFDYESADKFSACEDVEDDVRQKVIVCLNEVKQDRLSLIDKIVERNKKAIEELTEKIEQLKKIDPSTALSKAKEQALQMKPKIDRAAKAGTCFCIVALVLILGLWRVVFAAKNFVFAHPVWSILIIIALIVLTVISDFALVGIPVFAVREGILWLYKGVRQLVVLLYEKKTQSKYIADDLEEITKSFANYEIDIHVKNQALEYLDGWQKEIEEYKEIYQQADPEDIETYSVWRDIKERVDILSENLVTVRLVKFPQEGARKITLLNPPQIEENWAYDLCRIIGGDENEVENWQYPVERALSPAFAQNCYDMEKLRECLRKHGVRYEEKECDWYQMIAEDMNISREQAVKLELPATMFWYALRAVGINLKQVYEFGGGEIELVECEKAQ